MVDTNYGELVRFESTLTPTCGAGDEPVARLGGGYQAARGVPGYHTHMVSVAAGIGCAVTSEGLLQRREKEASR